MEIESFIQNQLSKLEKSTISLQISCEDAVSVLESFYQKGRADSERDIRESIAKQQAEEYITKSEAMALLGKSDNTLWKWNRKGYLQWIKRGGTIVYRKSEVMEILNGKK